MSKTNDLFFEEGVCSGAGGQGMVGLAKFIADAYLAKDFNMKFYPSYGPEMRGGAARGHYMVSNEEMASSIVSDFDVGIIANEFSLNKFIWNAEKMEEREEKKAKGEKDDNNMLRDGGILIYNTSLITTEELKKATEGRDKLSIYGIPTEDLKTGNFINTVLLGAYLQAGDNLKPELVEKVLKAKLGDSPKFAENMKNLEAGMDYVRKTYQTK